MGHWNCAAFGRSGTYYGRSDNPSEGPELAVLARFRRTTKSLLLIKYRMPWIGAIIQFFTGAVNLFGKAFRLLRRIPFCDDLFSRIQIELFNPVSVRRVRDPKDPDLHSALGLYEKRISAGLRFESADIIRWLADDLEVCEHDPLAPRDFFFVAKYKRQVKGFILSHYYPARKLLFLAYMVVDGNPVGLPINHISNSLCSYVSHLLKSHSTLKHCGRFVLEVEDPRAVCVRKRLEAQARIRRFCSLAAANRLTMLSFGIEYFQPQLSVPESGLPTEEPLILLVAVTRPSEMNTQMTHEWAKKEILDLFGFIYCELYPMGFSDIPSEQAAYEAYCRELYDRAVARLPTEIEICNPIHFTLQTAAHRILKNGSESESI